MSVLDPACGSGNFLYVSLKELLDLEKEVSTFAGEIRLTPFFPEVSPEQLHGIETSPYAHELAQVAIWIGYLQWLVENGFGTRQEPILGPMTNIVEMDAILTRGEDGTVREPDWPEADVIVGNPPFLGGKRLRTELGDEYIEPLFKLYEGRVPRRADLVTYWFERSRSEIASGRAKRAGLLATNSIRQQQNRPVLSNIKRTGDIFMAWSDRPWVLEGAAVHVSIVGFDNGEDKTRTLDGVSVRTINADLTGSLDLTGVQLLRENAGICLRADEKGGPFDISDDTAQSMLQALVNVNGRPNSDVVRPWMKATDVTRRPRRRWIIDFGIDTRAEEAAQYELPFQYVAQHVKPVRVENRMPRLREEWWLHRIPGARMRSELQELGRYIVTPVTAKHRVFAWVPSDG